MIKKFKEFIKEKENTELNKIGLKELLKIRLKTEDDKFVSSSLVGEINTTYDSLINLLGEPNSTGDEYKIDVEWEFYMNNKLITIYNWKDGKNYNGEEGLDVENITDWHVGSNHRVTFPQFGMPTMQEIIILQEVLNSLTPNNTNKCFLSSIDDLEEIGDQFLRLEEVFNCKNVIIPIELGEFKCFISVKSLKNDKSELEEISRIQRYLGDKLIPITNDEIVKEKYKI